MNNNEFNVVERLGFPFLIVGLMWLVKIIEILQGYKFTRWGIFPRELDGLVGIIVSPFLHSDPEHLMSNSLPMIMLLVIMMMFYKRIAIPSFIIITLLTGFMVWLFARTRYHVGASGVVYGLVALVAWTGIFRRNLKSIVLAFVILILYSGYFHCIVPDKEGVSWESHLFGGLMGIFTAFLFKNVVEDDELERPDPWADEIGTETNFFRPDTFQMTKQERYLQQFELQRALERANEADKEV